MSIIGEIFKSHGEEYRKNHKLPLNILKVMAAIEKCRTSELGGHIFRCENCKKEYLQYNSCRNRHCPTCQRDEVESWVEKRKEEILPVRYFHIIFTVPAELNDIFQRNQRIMYDMLFKATSKTLMTLMEDSKYVGGKAGFMSVLHTWGQNMMEHPHIHILVPAGGLSKDEGYWIKSKYEKYLIPVQVLSALFKKKFMAMFEEAYTKGAIKTIGKISWLIDGEKYKKFKDKMHKKGWVVHARKPFSTADIVIEYLSRYLKKVAISNSRIKKVKDKEITFRWKDNRDSKEKHMTISSEEFIRRYLLHVLPDRYVKVRYYGFMSNKMRKEKTQKCRELLKYLVPKVSNETAHKDNDEENTQADRDNIKNKWSCPFCKKRTVIIIRKTYRYRTIP